ncbi:CGCGG family putative rSAM-modified RiPP protein [Haloarchaeobius iranensis]|uniref:Putative rSAM target protein, CGCGG family n=1 Tax=Haloarchaeobius iranensis TaxID=996166 RepID=A0A1G9TLV4_9EURY|nr:CGCGG family rSAM-modified RiPP protein [Haloarchaeobius iranensis]SDM48717.1 putative rSAM target protein, CGCGG family [Haloarchaeobius iranensis]
MPSVSHDDTEPADGPAHEGSWSVNLEQPEYADSPASVVDDALAAIAATRPGFHVNLVTHGDCGHPERYLFDALAEAVGDAASWEYVEQCGCGGHVTRVHLEDDWTPDDDA